MQKRGTERNSVMRERRKSKEKIDKKKRGRDNKERSNREVS
jgi:hypothetical protein